jgi:solute:Na+ symporter, SSS family
MITVTLVQSPWRLVPPGRSRQRGVTALALAAMMVVAGLACWPWLTGHGLTGLLLGAVTVTAFGAAVLLTEGTGPARTATGGPAAVLARVPGDAPATSSARTP